MQHAGPVVLVRTGGLPMSEPVRIVLVVEDGELVVSGLPDGYVLVAHDYDWGETLVNGYVERGAEVPEGAVERDAEQAPYVRYDVPEIQRCEECGRAVEWDEAVGDYRHADPTAPGCGLALAGRDWKPE